MSVTPSADGTPPISGKFIGYGPTVHTELRGEVLSIDPKALCIAPDPNYTHLCVRGNEIQPGSADALDPGYAQVYAAAAGRPVIKCELYGVGSWPDPTGNKPVGPPLVAGKSRPIALRDHIRIRGFYVVDCDHPIGRATWTPSFEVGRGIYEAGYTHAELHPYDYDDVALVSELPASEQLAESHTFGVPRYPETYTKTQLANRAAGLDGHIVDVAAEHLQVVALSLPAPAPVSGTSSLTLSLTGVQQWGPPPSLTFKQIGTSTLDVGITLREPGRGFPADMASPTVYTGTFAAVWGTNASQGWVTVPNVVGKPPDAAEAELKAARLDAIIIAVEVNNRVQDKKVTSQDILAGTVAVAGTTVGLTVAQPKPEGGL